MISLFISLLGLLEFHNLCGPYSWTKISPVSFRVWAAFNHLLFLEISYFSNFISIEQKRMVLTWSCIYCLGITLSSTHWYTRIEKHLQFSRIQFCENIIEKSNLSLNDVREAPNNINLEIWYAINQIVNNKWYDLKFELWRWASRVWYKEGPTMQSLVVSHTCSTCCLSIISFQISINFVRVNQYPWPSLVYCGHTDTLSWYLFGSSSRF